MIILALCEMLSHFFCSKGRVPGAQIVVSFIEAYSKVANTYVQTLLWHSQISFQSVVDYVTYG